MRSFALVSIAFLAVALPVLSSPTPGQELSNPDFAKRAEILSSQPLQKRKKASKKKKTTHSGGSGSSLGAHTVALHSSSDFCLLLPKPYGGNIADNEQNAIAFCQNPSSAQRAFPSGFITAATYYSNTSKKYVQVTGCINRSKYGLSASDQGGQLDYNAPKGAVCQGYPYFVSQIEPSNNRFCIRCCTATGDCPQDKDEDGCTELMPNGKYSYPGVDCSN